MNQKIIFDKDIIDSTTINELVQCAVLFGLIRKEKKTSYDLREPSPHTGLSLQQFAYQQLPLHLFLPALIPHLLLEMPAKRHLAAPMILFTKPRVKFQELPHSLAMDEPPRTLLLQRAITGAEPKKISCGGTNH
ncbi:hypothetical protein KFK09_009237 [Dendrobium nobile]|uniref:Uncharacterized protein n=1 Tax=Dendrobium nobile TaxID=94219 RepID=A0A8T3BS35_DENNO|nr:hypothetical protein KFK09_009237 [Dendrobium nobile]